MKVMSWICLLPLLLLLTLWITRASSITLTLTNGCLFDVWVHSLALDEASTPPVNGLFIRESKVNSVKFDRDVKVEKIEVQLPFNGFLWVKRGCTPHRPSCITGECYEPTANCIPRGATLVRLKLGLDEWNSYAVSLVHGYDIDISVVPLNDNCPSIVCDTLICPFELTVLGGSCESPCNAFNGNPRLCCSGEYDSPTMCKPSLYAKQVFDVSCPDAYSYKYDNGSKTKTCSAGTNYNITFCPSGIW